MNMASGIKMLTLLILWITTFVILLLMNIAGGEVFPPLMGLFRLVGSNPAIDPSQFGYLPAMFNVLLLVVLAVMTYKIFRESIAGDDTYYPGY